MVQMTKQSTCAKNVLIFLANKYLFINVFLQMWYVSVVKCCVFLYEKFFCFNFIYEIVIF